MTDAAGLEQLLEAILINTYNPDKTLRGQAEEGLKQFFTAPLSLSALIKFVGGTQRHRELRLAAAIQIKNKLRDYWCDKAIYPSSSEEREQFKTTLVDVLLLESDKSLRGIMAESVKLIAEYDFPEKWSSLLPTLISNIQTPDVLKVYNALSAMRKLVKRYEYKPKEERATMDHIIQSAFPYLQNLMSNLVSVNSLEAAQVMRVCLKIFHSATVYRLPVVQGVDVNFWFQIIANIMNKPLPEASTGEEPTGQPVDPEERKQWPWWKLKKWAFRIVVQFIQRYGNPRHADDEFQAFAKFFRENTAATLLAPVLNNLGQKSQGAFLTDEVHRMCITYVGNCVEMAPTFKVIKPHMDFLLFNIVFPVLCLDMEDIQLFDEDPAEFVRKIHNPLREWVDPFVAATSLLQSLARYRQKYVLPKLMPFMYGVLTEYNAASPETRDYRKKDAVMVAVASISKILLESAEYKHVVLSFLAQHVVPEFTSPVGFIRSRAMWVIEYFSELDWSSTEATATLNAILQGLINGLRDPAVPVQAAAACSLRVLLETEESQAYLKPMLGQIVVEYFRIMDEVDNESVMSALQAIVDQFPEEMAPMAPQMVDRLIVSFRRYAGEKAAGSDDDDEAEFNACQCLDTICSVIDAVQENEAAMLQLEVSCIPLMNSILENGDNAFEYIDSAVQFMSYFTYYGATITSGMWSLCGPLLHALEHYAADYISEIMVPVLNYLTKGTPTFLQMTHRGKPMVHTLLSIIANTFENDTTHTQVDSKAAATMLTALITSAKDCKGINDLIPPMLMSVLGKFATAKSGTMRIRLHEVVMSALHYDAPLTVAALASDAPMLDLYFTALLGALKDMERDFTQRLIVLSFTALLQMPPTMLPDIIKTNMQAMLKQVVAELTIIEENEKEEAARIARGGDDEDEELESDDDEIDDEEDEDDEELSDDEDDANAARERKRIERAAALAVPDGGYDEDTDCLNAEDESYREMLETMDKEDRVKRQLYLDGEPVDDEDDDDFVFTSPIEMMNMTQYFLDAIRDLAMRDAAVASALQAGLSPEEKAQLNSLVTTAAEKAAKAAAEGK